MFVFLLRLFLHCVCSIYFACVWNVLGLVFRFIYVLWDCLRILVGLLLDCFGVVFWTASRSVLDRFECSWCFLVFSWLWVLCVAICYYVFFFVNWKVFCSCVSRVRCFSLFSRCVRLL